MSKLNFSEISPEMRSENLEKARIVREAKQEAGKNLKQDWLDAPLWAYLRSEVGLRSPPSYIPCSETKYIKRTLKAIGKDNEWYYENFSSPMTKFAKDNPNVPAYVLQGLMMEAARPDLVAKFRGVGE